VFTLDDPAWPLGRGTLPARITTLTATAGGGLAENALLADDRAVAGRVAQSVLFDRVAIARGAAVGECVLLPGASVGPGCRLRGVIVNSGCHVPAGTCCELDTEAAHFEPLVLGVDAAALSAASYAHAR
jgi:glucose-1-phosphate adenylyltransferase